MVNKTIDLSKSQTDAIQILASHKYEGNFGQSLRYIVNGWMNDKDKLKIKELEELLSLSIKASRYVYFKDSSDILHELVKKHNDDISSAIYTGHTFNTRGIDQIIKKVDDIDE